MFQRSHTGGTPPLAVRAVALLLLICVFMTGAAGATAAKPTVAPLGGFIKDPALARVLGETLFRDTVEVMSDSSVPPAVAATVPAAAGQLRDNSAAGQVARTVLAHESLDKYLWLILQAYDDVLWKGGDRARIEQHFPLIWRTSIMLYEATLNASPQRVRMCTPADDGESFNCRDEIERAKVVPIPAQAPLLGVLHQPNVG